MTTIAQYVSEYLRTRAGRVRLHITDDLAEVCQPETEPRPVEELIADVIRDVTNDRGCPTVPRWELGETESGLPLVSGRISVPDPREAQRKLAVFAEIRHWQLRVDDPARIAIEGVWPDDRQPQAVVELWGPAAGAP